MNKPLERLLTRFLGSGLGATLLRGASIFLVISVVGTGITFLLHVLLARVLGAESYGRYAYATTWLAILLLGGHLGFQTGSIRFVSEYCSARDWSSLRGFLHYSSRVVWVGSLVTAGLTAGIVLFLRTHFGLNSELARSLWVAALVIPVVSIMSVSAGQLRGFKAVSRSQVPVAIVHPVCFGAIVLLLTTFPEISLAAPWAMGANLGSALIACALSLFFLRRTIPTPMHRVEPTFHRRQWRGVAASLLIVSSVQLVRSHLVVVILGFYQAAAEIGFYTSANRIATLSMFGLTAVAAWAAPMIAEYHAAEDKSRLQRLARLAAWCSAGFMVPVTIVLLVFGHEILGLFGPEFKAGYLPLVILALRQLVNAAMGPVGYLLTMTGNQARAARIESSTAALAVILSLVLIPSYGLVGAACADAASNLLRNLAMFAVVWKRLGVRCAII